MLRRVLLLALVALIAFAATLTLAEYDDGMVQPLFLEEGQTLEALSQEEQMNAQVNEEADLILSELEAQTAAEMQALEGESESDEMLLEMGGEPEEGSSPNPSYLLTYPPVLPGHYSPLFNPYTNVNPLSTPFANYAAQPGAHPGVAAAAAAQAGALAAINGQVAGAGGAMPFYPYAARHPVIAGQLAGNPVPFSGYAGWINPQNMNSVGVGANGDTPAEFPQFVEVATESTEDTGCVGCSFD